MEKDNFQETCVRYLLETILVIRQSIETIDENQKARAGALLGSQAVLLTEFLRKNRKNPLVGICTKELEVAGKKHTKILTRRFAEEFQEMLKELREKNRKEKESEGGLSYVG